MAKAEAPRGEILRREWSSSSVYPGTKREFSIYVPAQYDGSQPACLMVFQDGDGFISKESGVAAPRAMDTLIDAGEMPVTVGLFVNSGTYASGEDSRFLEYVDSAANYARFLTDEMIPEVARDYHLVEAPEGRAICGMSDGGLCAFAVAWEHPERFSKVVSYIGSFARQSEGSPDYARQVRQTRRDPKAIRVFLQDGRYDLNIEQGNWTLGNINLADALSYGRYDYRFELGDGGHDLQHGGRVFPDAMRWLWRDYHGVKGAFNAPDCSEIEGTWQMQGNGFGTISRSRLTITASGDGLAAALLGEGDDGDIDVTRVSFDGHRLIYTYRTPPSQQYWGKNPSETMTAWLELSAGALTGVVTGDITDETSFDFSLTGQRAN